MNGAASRLSGREAIVTLAACALLGFEAVPSLLFGLSFFSGVGFAPFLLGAAAGLASGVALGAALLRQGGFCVPSGWERGVTRGAIVGLVVGVAAVLMLSAPAFGMLGFCALVGLAVGRTFDRRGIHPTA